MTYIYITDQKSIYNVLLEKKLTCYYFNSNFSVKFDAPGVLIKELDISGMKHNICLSGGNSRILKDINSLVKSNSNVCLVNATSPCEKSQFNFDMLLTQLSERQNISQVMRLWINDINDLIQLDSLNQTNMIANEDFKNISQFYLLKKLIDDYWSNSKIISKEGTNLTLQHYYVLSLIVNQDQIISSKTQSTYYTANASCNEMNGKLYHFKKYKFQSINQVRSLILQPSTFMIIKSKYSESNVAKPLLYTISSLIKATSKVKNFNSTIQSLFEKGLITNPNTKNHTIPQSLVSSIIQNMELYGIRYNHVLSHVKSYGIDRDMLKQHISDNYVNDYIYDKDRSHAILPIPSTKLLNLNEDELYVYDLLVLRYFTMFMPNGVKYTKKVEAVSSNNTRIILVKNGDLHLGCTLLENTINKIFQEISTDTKILKESLKVGSVIEHNSISFDIKGYVSNTTKELNENQLIGKLSNMGKNLIPRKMKLKYRNFGIGDAISWRSCIDQLESRNLIIRNDDKTISLSDKGMKFRNETKAYLLNIENLNNWHIDMVKVLTGEKSINEVLVNHISSIKTLENSVDYKSMHGPNYKKIIANSKCKCGCALKEYSSFIGCSSFPICKVTLPKVITSNDSYQLTEHDFKDLLTLGETTTLIEKFEFKSGNRADIYLKLNEHGKVTYKFSNHK